MVSSVTFEDITRQFENELRNRRPLVSTEVLPISYEEISPAWMTRALGKHFPGARVVGCRLGETDEGTSSRRRIFLDWKDSADRELPRSVFCKGTLSLESRFILGMNGGIEAEVTFYKTVRPNLSIVAPEAYFAAFDPKSLNSIIV